jgi:DeoR family fructose operon transcriptional repressor
MQDYTSKLGIELEVVDVEQTLKDEIDWRRREVARCAAEEIRPGETISMDSGVISMMVAEELSKTEKPITVLSNSLPVMDSLRDNPNITLISTGGVLRRSSMNLVGPTAEATLREMRVDKLFLTVNGVSLDFGLSHSNLSEVTIKQTMIRSAREVILLADHTCFGQEAFIQVAPVTVVNRLITDDALPASVRLELSKLGIRVLMATA